MNNVRKQNSQRAVAAYKYSISRQNLLLMIILTAINIIFLFMGSEYFLLFSATVPYISAVTGIVAVESIAASSIFIGICFAVAAVSIIAYVLCWLLSKKHYGWMIAALVMFVIDTALMAWLYISSEDPTGILDVLIHVWVMYYLISGVINGRKLKTIPEEIEAVPDETDDTDYYVDINIPSTPLRTVDETVKARILLEADFAGHHISYRRVKRTNELVVDSHIYDEVEMLVEIPHTLRASVYGYEFQAGNDGVKSFICVNGSRVAEKRRLW